jgi:hypothetical protein
MNRAATMTWAIAGVAVAALLTLAAMPFLTTATAAPHPHARVEAAPTTVPTPTPTPTVDPDRVIWLGDGISVKASELPKGCTTYSKIDIFDVNGRSYGRLVGDAQDRGSAEGATGTVTSDSAGKVIGYVAAPGDDVWSVGDRLCTNPLMLGRYNHIGSRPGEHVLQQGETVVVRPDMNVEWVPGG